MLQPVPMSLLGTFNKIAHIKKLQALPALDVPAQQKLASLKVDVYNTVIKAANASSLISHVTPALKTVGKGMALGAGAAIPLGVAGKVVADDAVENARDKALQAGVGLAGIGSLYHGVTRGVDALINQRMNRQPRANLSVSRQYKDPSGDPMSANLNYSFFPKQSADRRAVFLKLASMGYLDTLIKSVDKTALSEKGAELLASINRTNQHRIADVIVELA